MLCNIIDSRNNKYKWKHINAIIEPTWHDNAMPDADQAEMCANEIQYDQREGILLSDAIDWANNFPFYVTLFLYDENDGIAQASDFE